MKPIRCSLFPVCQRLHTFATAVVSAGASHLPKICLAAFGVGALNLLSGCTVKTPDPQVLAKIGTREIRAEELSQELERRANSSRPRADKEAVLEELIIQEVLVQKARAAGLEKDPEVQRAYRNLLATKLKQRELKPQLEAAQITSDEVRARYDQTIQKYTVPAKANLAIIFIPTAPRTSEQRRAEIQARIEEARKQALEQPSTDRGFGTLAMNYSEDRTTRFKGGDIGWFDVGQEKNTRWPAEVISAGLALKKSGDVSEIVKTDKGYYLVKKVDTREAVATPFGQLEATLRHQLQTEKKHEIEQNYHTRVRSERPIQLYPRALDAVVPPPIATAKTEEPQPPSLP